MPKTSWQPISSAPFNRDLEVAVLEGGDTHALLIRCRRAPQGWINAANGKLVDVNPTHWREWRDRH
jgi:hypothetical protein